MPIGLLFAGAVAVEAITCGQIPGADGILNDRAIRWIIVGERHGTAEAPEIFGDLACLAAIRGRKPVVAVEFPNDATDAIRQFVTSPDEVAARDQLLAHPFWHGPVHDGRSSRAMLTLFTRLRQWKRSNIISDVIAFQPTTAATGEAYEQAMALNLERMSAGENLVVALVGNVHAQLTRRRFLGGSYLPMAGYLPRSQTLSYNIGDNGGAQWACFAEVAEKSGMQCGSRDSGLAARKYERGFLHIGGEERAYSGYLNLGTVTTASEPALPNSDNNKPRK